VSYYVHKFEVEMVVENIRSPKVARSWIMARLDGGDATYDAEHKGVSKMTKKAARTYENGGVDPDEEDGA
jgi:hypothetical protein